jgi:hypothetical protein
MLRPVSDPDARAPRARPLLPSITREVSPAELAPLVDATRSAEEIDTAALGGAEMDQLLAEERKEAGQAAAPAIAARGGEREAARGSERATGERPGDARVAVAPMAVPVASVPVSLAPEPTVVLAPGLDAVPARAPQETIPLVPGLHAGLPADPLAQPTMPLAPGIGPAPGFTAPPGERLSPPGERSPWRVEAILERDVARAAAARGAAEAPRRKGLSIAVGMAVGLVAAVAVGLAWWTPWRGGGSASGTSDAPAGTADSPAGTGSLARGTGDAPRGTGSSARGTADSPAGTSNAPRGTADPAGGTPDAPPGSPEADARAALSRLRDGVATCVRDVIGVLPGTSPAVPLAFTALKRGGYKASPRDFRSPVFACVKYRESGPQRFQLQWQLTAPPGEGRGVAWLDDNGDGKPDRALAFRAALVRKNEVDLGEIGPLAQVPPVMKVKE